MDLHTFFKRNKIKPTPWAKEKKISPSVISRYLNGHGMSPANAKKVSRAANYQVTIFEILYPKPHSPSEPG